MKRSLRDRSPGLRFASSLAVTARPLLHRLPRGGTRLVRWLRLTRLVDPPERVGRIAGGALIRADLRDRIQCQMYWLGVYERPETQWLLSQLRRGDVFVDIGAHVGYYTLLAASRVGTTGAVHAFEPFPENWARLRSNLDLNGYSHVAPHQCAVSDQTAESAFEPPTVVTERGWGHLTSEASANGLRVRTVRLDDYVASEKLTRITGIKLDIEGSEERALAGMAFTLQDVRPRFVMMELNRYTLITQGTSPSALVRTMRSYGYAPYRLGHRRLLRMTNTEVDAVSFLDLAIFLPDPEFDVHAAGR